jgi:hypothetical protein
VNDAESLRLAEDARRARNWKRWGPYLAERQWGTVREDYSPSGECWGYFTHDQARSRAYRWGEDGLLGFSDRQGRLCFALALWNESSGSGVSDRSTRFRIACGWAAPTLLSSVFPEAARRS